PGGTAAASTSTIARTTSSDRRRWRPRSGPSPSSRPATPRITTPWLRRSPIPLRLGEQEGSMTMLTLALAVLLQDQVDNPEYKGWAAFKPGSSVTHKVQNNVNPQGGDQKTTLKSVGDAELVVEVAMTLGGQPLGKPMERKIPAKVPADKAPKDVKK